MLGEYLEHFLAVIVVDYIFFGKIQIGLDWRSCCCVDVMDGAFGHAIKNLVERRLLNVSFVLPKVTNDNVESGSC